MKYIIIKYFDYIAEKIFVFDNYDEAEKYYEEVENIYKDRIYTHFELKEVPNNSKILESKLVVKKK